MAPISWALWLLQSTWMEQDLDDTEVSPAPSPASFDRASLASKPGNPCGTQPMSLPTLPIQWVIAFNESPSPAQPPSPFPSPYDTRVFRLKFRSAPRGGFQLDSDRVGHWVTPDKRSAAPERPPPDDPSLVKRGSRRPRTVPTRLSLPPPALGARDREFKQRRAHVRPALPTPARASPTPEVATIPDPA